MAEAKAGAIAVHKPDEADLQASLRALGGALEDGAERVVAQITHRAQRRRARAGEPPLDAAVEASFMELGALATAAVARWLGGEPVGAAAAAGAEFSRVFGALAASRDVSVGEVLRRCRYWRDACQLALKEAAARTGTDERALGRGNGLVQQAADSAVAKLSAIFDDERRRIKEELARRQAELSFLATHDPLTRLANRALIVETLERMLARSARDQGPVAALFIDLDDFKLVNDTLSHRAGDRLLVAVARRLRETVRAADTVGRLGGDEFVVLAEPAAEDPRLLGARLCEALAAPFDLEGEPAWLHARASIGIATASAESSAEQLLCDADIAMYGAKSRGGGYALYEPGMQEKLPVRHRDLIPVRARS